MSDGSSTWALGDNGGWSIVSNEASNDGGGANCIEYCDSMANTANVHVRAKYRAVAGNGGVVARYTDASNFYYGRWNNGDGEWQLYVSTTLGGMVQVDAVAGTCGVGDIVGIRCIGTTITVEKNGVTVITATSQSDHATGKAGIRSAGNANQSQLDDFLVETAST